MSNSFIEFQSVATNGAWDWEADEAVDAKEGRAKAYFLDQKGALFQYLKTHPRESVRVVAHGVLEEPFHYDDDPRGTARSHGPPSREDPVLSARPETNQNGGAPAERRGHHFFRYPRSSPSLEVDGGSRASKVLILLICA